MRCSCLIVVALASCGGDPTGELAYQVRHYDVRADLADATLTIAATLDVIEGGDCLAIPSRAAPRTALWNGNEPRQGEHDGQVLHLCGGSVDSDSELTIEVTSDLIEETLEDTQVGYSVTTDIEGAPFRYLVSWVGGCDRFGPCDSDPSQFATYRFEIEHAVDAIALCPGAIVRSEGLTVCETDFSAPTYSAFGFAVSPSWTEVDLGSWDTAEVTLYDMPSSATASRLQGGLHEQFLAWMRERFGAYPYGPELRLAVGPTQWRGFEHPGNIVLNDELSNSSSPLAIEYDDVLTHVVNHELAHMWAGNRTTLASEKDFVWKEAVVEYLTFVFEDEVLGPGTSAATARYWKAASQSALHFAAPQDDVPLTSYYGDAYGPGAMILFRQLEALFDRPKVLAAIADVLAEPGAIGIDDLQAALEMHLGADLDGYLDAWLRGRGEPEWPQFTVATNQVGDQITVEVTQVAPATPLGCAFAVELRGAADERAEVWIDRGVDGQSVVMATATVPFTVVETRLDPHAQALAFAPGVSKGRSSGHPWQARKSR